MPPTRRSTLRPARPPSPHSALGADGKRRAVPERVALQVWCAAGGRCTMCNRYLLTEEHTGVDVPIGQLAHIAGWSTAAGSPRGDDELPPAQRDTPENLMLLCYDQHKVIDDRSLWERFDAGSLRSQKRRHEHRIKQVTGLGDDRRTTVLRLVGNLHGQGVELSESAVASALASHNRYPDYALLGVDEFECDLRPLAGERAGTTGYWAAARDLMAERLDRLALHVAKANVTHLTVFAIARVPLLITLGLLLDDKIPTQVLPKRRGGDEGWGWTPDSPVSAFEHRVLREGNDPHAVALVFSVSGTVDQQRLPDHVDERTSVYELRPVGVAPDPTLISNQLSLDNFARCWASLLSELEHRHPGLESADVFAAVPVTAAVAIGRGVMRAIHPRLRLHDRDTNTDTYRLCLETDR